MRISEITWRHRNDFKFIADCRHCGKQSRHGDGYADNFYCTVVVPDRCCEHCGLNEFGETEDAKQARNERISREKTAAAQALPALSVKERNNGR